MSIIHPNLDAGNSQLAGLAAICQKGPAFAVGNNAVDKNNTLTVENDASLVAALAKQGFIAE